MSKFMVFSVLFFTSMAQASHYVTCELEAKVESIVRIERLGGTSVVSHAPEIVTPDFEQIATLEVLSIGKLPGDTNCPLHAGDKVTLLIEKTQYNTYFESQTLKLKYRNVGDRAGASITWEVLP